MRSRFFLIAVVTFLLVGCTADTRPPSMTTSENEPTAAATGEWQATASGLKYRILTPGPGAKPVETDKVQVHYKGWLPDPTDPSTGEVFDSSYDRGEPISFPLNGVIAGWTEGMQLVGKGGKIELEIPSDLGYGEQGTPGGPIPPNATLRFVVELLDIIEPPKPGPIDADAPEEFTTTDSGLKYRVLRKGDGVAPTASDTVMVHYKGWLPDSNDRSTGPEFDSSYARGEPISFPLGGVIAGWTEGLQLVSKGGMIELDIPSELAYGDRAMGNLIQPNSDLRFIVELLEIQ